MRSMREVLFRVVALLSCRPIRLWWLAIAAVAVAMTWLPLLNALTGWNFTESDLLASGERIQNLRQAFNVREGLKPADFKLPPRAAGEGDGLLQAGPLKGVTVPIEELRRDYFLAMNWSPETGRVSRAHAQKLGIDGLLGQYAE